VTETAVDRLLNRARDPVGPDVEVDFDAASGPFADLAAMLTRRNGFFAFDAGLQVFHAGGAGGGPELLTWNTAEAWKYTYGGLADELFCFGQDVLGTQFAIKGGNEVVTFDPETAETTRLGDSLETWAEWVLDDPAVNATAGLARAWQDANRPLALDERLVPLRFLVAGGEISLENLVAREAVTAMRIRGPIAQRIAGLPDGARIEITID
jgi:hypothetical protein